MKYKVVILALFCLAMAACGGNPKTKSENQSSTVDSISVMQEVDIQALPHEGEIVQTVNYSDNAGAHSVLLTAWRKSHSESGQNVSDGYLNAYDYLLDGEPVLLWKMQDSQPGCDDNMSLDADFVENALQVTDLDNNGTSEVWLMYRLRCAGDVSPAVMKLIMHEGKNKYALRGHSKAIDEGGDYKMDESFNTLPAAIKQYAENLWEKFITGYPPMNQNATEALQPYSFEGITFRYSGRDYNLSDVCTANTIMSCTPVGDYIVIEGHVNAQIGVYVMFSTKTSSMETALYGNNLIWRDNDISTALYSDWGNVRDYNERVVASVDLADDEFISQLEFADNNTEVKITIYNEAGERTETKTLQDI